jgi:transketolase
MPMTATRPTNAELAAVAAWVREKTLEMAVSAGSGHVSSASSQTELLVALYLGGVLRVDPKNPQWPDRDRFVLSKGQGGIGLYPILARRGFFPESELDRFAAEGSSLGVHAEWHVPGIEVVSGSLGHGLPIATGMAEAARLENRDHLVVVFLGDAELAEGSNWEAALYAGSRGLGNIVAIVDRNGQGVLGFTDRIESRRDGPRLGDLVKKYEAFGWEARAIDGHSFPAIFGALAGIRERPRERPLVVIAETVKGRGISFMEDQRLWHYRVPEGAELEIARRELAEARIAAEAATCR